MDYKKSIKLPKTKFPMRGNLAQKEPVLLKRWNSLSMYDKLRHNSQEYPQFILHDGPPYANGNIHIGHALNKILKDVIVKYMQMSGYNSPYVPGWDCHGLPIEKKAEQLLESKGKSKKDLPVASFRRMCRQFASKWIDKQKKEFKRLGIFGDWDNPYLTMDNSFEATIVEELGKLYSSGVLYNALKPVHWCPNCQTALADAEVEHKDHISTAIYVAFKLDEYDNKYLVAWTTTPWSLSANQAVCLNPEGEYTEYEVIESNNESIKQSEFLILDSSKDKEFWESTFDVVLSSNNIKIGTDFENTKVCHPYQDKKVPVLVDNYVELGTGTGCVHLAPDHGDDDFKVCKRYGIDPINPMNNEGTYLKDEVLKGNTVFEVEDIVLNLLLENKTLLAQEKITHSYPHCWRCDNPIITRATPQWFVSIPDNTKEEMVNLIENVNWIPSWGENRIKSMVETKPDWCVSRQRSWGVPIPMIYCQSCGENITDDSVFNTVVSEFEQHSSDIWYMKDASYFLPEDHRCPKCSGDSFQKESDILDVWFDSGVTHAAVLKKRNDLSYPADLYLEGTDQHRGWFQSSMTTALLNNNDSPYKSILTHGMVVDKKGEKMSKSKGNVVTPDEIINTHGADILRMWAVSEDYTRDIKLSDKVLHGLLDSYKRIRNTTRFLLGGISDFSKDDIVEYDSLDDSDKWVLYKLQELTANVRCYYAEYKFHRIIPDIQYFCAMDLGAFYLEMVKDRLYCDATDSTSRRSAQTVMYHLLNHLIKMIAPILPFTSEEAWEYFDSENVSIHLEKFPDVNLEWDNEKLGYDWNALKSVRTDIYRLLEVKRRDEGLKSFLKAEITLGVSNNDLFEILNSTSNLNKVFGVSKVNILRKDHTDNDVDIDIGLSEYKKCERCWNFDVSVGNDSQYIDLCDRCVNVLN